MLSRTEHRADLASVGETPKGSRAIVRPPFILLLAALLLGVSCEVQIGDYSIRALHNLGGFTVVNGEVKTGITLEAGDVLILVSYGKIDFGGAVLGIGAPVLNADGDSFVDPNYPFPGIRKNSLTYRIGNDPWLQGGVSTSLGVVVPYRAGLKLEVNDLYPDDNSGYWEVIAYAWQWESTTEPDPDPDDDGLSTAKETTLGTSLENPDTDGDRLYDGVEANIYGTDPLKDNRDFNAIARNLGVHLTIPGL